MSYIILSVWAVAAVGGTIWALILRKKQKNEDPCDSCPFRDEARHQKACLTIYSSAPPGEFAHYANTQRIIQDAFDSQCYSNVERIKNEAQYIIQPRKDFEYTSTVSPVYPWQMMDE